MRSNVDSAHIFLVDFRVSVCQKLPDEVHLQRTFEWVKSPVLRKSSVRVYTRQKYARIRLRKSTL